MTIAQAQARVDTWITTIGVRYFEPLTNLGILMEEVGEVARIIVRRQGEQSFKPGEEATADLAGEMADVLFVLLALANQSGVDLTQALEASLEKKTKRDAHRYKDNEKLG